MLGLDQQTALVVLLKHSWNVEMGVQGYFDNPQRYNPGQKENQQELLKFQQQNPGFKSGGQPQDGQAGAGAPGAAGL